jgi:hypothetical protein
MQGFAGSAGYAFAFGVLPLDATKPIIWVHIAPTRDGNHRSIEDEEEAVADACEALGMRVMDMATDGDRQLDERLREAFALYSVFAEGSDGQRPTLAVVIGHILESQGVPSLWFCQLSAQGIDRFLIIGASLRLL